MSGVSDRYKKQSAAVPGKHRQMSDAIPWSQQVDEAFNDNSTSAENKSGGYWRHSFGYEMNDDGKKVGRLPVDNHPSSAANESNKKKITWASIASQPAKPNKKNNNVLLKKKGPGMPPPPMIPGKHSLDVNTWEFSSNVTSPETSGSIPVPIPINESESATEDDVSAKMCDLSVNEQQYNRKLPVFPHRNMNNIKPNYRQMEVTRDRRFVQKHNEDKAPNMKPSNTTYSSNYMDREFSSTDDERIDRDNTQEQSNSIMKVEPTQQPNNPQMSHVVLKQLRDRNNYNPAEIDMQKAALSRFFVIKSYSEDDIHRSIKYEIWCSTDHGNKRLDEAFKERTKEGGSVMLFFSVNGSGHFCGMAQMITPVDYNSTSNVWSQDKWKGKFKVKWIYVKDVPNSQFRHIRLENNENKPVTNSRDTQEVPINKGLQVLKILHLYRHQTSIFDDFYHYEKKQEEPVLNKKPPPAQEHFVQPSSSHVFHRDIKERNMDRYSGHSRDRNIPPHRDDQQQRHFIGNRRFRNPMGNHPNKYDKDKQQQTKSLGRDSEENVTDTQSLQMYTSSSLGNCSS